MMSDFFEDAGEMRAAGVTLQAIDAASKRTACTGQKDAV